MAYNDSFYLPSNPTENWGTRYSGKPTGNPVFDGGKKNLDGTYGAYVDGGTGQAYNGPIGTGYSVNGKWQPMAPANAANPNNPALPKFDVIKTVKQPEVAAGVTSLLAAQAAQTAALAPDITKTLTTAGGELDRSYTASQKALDTTKVENQLTGSMSAEEAARRGLSDEQAKRNIDYKAETKSLLDKLTNQLNEGETAANATASAAASRALSASNLIPVASNPDVATTRSGANTSRALQAVINAMLPVSERFSAARYNQTANIEQPLNRELFQNDSALIAAKSSLEAQFGGNWRNIYQYIQSLKQQAAQMDTVNAERFIAQKLQLLGVPAQLLGGQITNLARLQQLDALANEYTFATPYDASRVPEIPNYTIAAPQRSYQSPNVIPDYGGRSYGNGVSPVPTLAAPGGVNPNQAMIDRAYEMQTGFKPQNDPNFSEYAYRSIANQFNAPRPTYAVPAVQPAGGGFTVNKGVVNPLGTYADIFTSGRNYGPLSPGEQDYFAALQRSYE